MEMSNPHNQAGFPYSDGVLPAFTPVNKEQRSEAANSVAVYRPNPAFKPPHRESTHHNVYDIPDADDGPKNPASKKGKRSRRPNVPTTLLSLSQTTTTPDSKKQTRKTSHPGQVKSTKSFSNTTVSEPSFSQNRSHSNNDKSSSNLYSSAPAANGKPTTMKFGIAMTTMQKLAAFRYQPSSTGSVHKAMGPSVGMLSGAVPDYREPAIKKGATPPATVVPAGEVVHRSRNKANEPCHDLQATRCPPMQTYDSNRDHSSEIANAHYQSLDSPLQQEKSRTAQALPGSFVFHSTHVDYSASAASTSVLGGSRSMAGQPDDSISRDLESGRIKSQSFFASMLSHAAALSTVPSTYDVTQGNSQYDDGLQDAGLHDIAAFDHQNRGPTPPTILGKPGVENVVPEETFHCENQKCHNHEPPAEPDEDMLDYENLDDLTAEPWNHMDYVAHEKIVKRADDMDLHTAEDLKLWQNQEANQENEMEYTADEAKPVHSHEKLANADVLTEERPSALVQATNPGEDNEDYFAALEDFDDEDFKESKVLPSETYVPQTTKVCHPDAVATVPEPEDKDYLAAFGDFNDEDFNTFKIPSGHKEVDHHHGVSVNPMPMAQVPATQYGPKAKDNNYQCSAINAIAANTPAFQQGSRDDMVDEEYPLDEEEQAELEYLRAIKREAVLETREPPSSIFHSEEDMRDMEMYDKRLKYSPVAPDMPKTSTLTKKLQEYRAELDEPLTEPEDWEFLRESKDFQASYRATTLAVYTNFANAQNPSANPDHGILDDKDYRPLAPFARPPFPGKVSARSPVTGVSSTLVLRTCFRVGEALSQASLCSRDNQDAVTELFARVTFAARETDAKKQNFQFGDIFHNKPPFISGVLEKCASSDLQQTDSTELITVGKEKGDGEVGEMVRVLGRVKRVIQGRGYTMEILNIRRTDWEEVRFTKRVLGA